MLAIIICSVISCISKNVRVVHIPDVVYQFGFFLLASVSLHHYFPHDTMLRIDRRFLWENMQPQTVIIMLLPPLSYECSLKLNSYFFYANFKKILMLAFFVYFVTLLLSGFFFFIYFFEDGAEKWSFSFLLASILASVDPVTTSPVIEDSGAPLRFRMLLEGETTITDGIGLFIVNFIDKYHSGHRVFDSTESAISLWTEFMVNFVLSPLLGWAAGHMVLRILLQSGMPSKLKQMFVLCIVYAIFTAAERAGGSSAITVVSFGMTMTSKKLVWVWLGLFWLLMLLREELGPRFWQESTFFWEMLSSLATCMIFSFSGYKVGMQMLNVQRSSEANDRESQVLMFVSAMFLSLVPIMSRMMAVSIVYNTVEGYTRVGQNEFALMVWGGMRGGVAMLMALMLYNLHQDNFSYQKLLLYTCGCVLPNILFQGTSFGNAVTLLGANMRSTYSRKAAKRLKEHLKRELSVKIVEMRHKVGEFLNGANWNCVDEYITVSLFDAPMGLRKKPSAVSSEPLVGEAPMEVSTDDDDNDQIDCETNEKDVYRTYYGMLLARISNEWERGALSGPTALCINDLLEHAVDDGHLTFDEIQKHVNKTRLSMIEKWIARFLGIFKVGFHHFFTVFVNWLESGMNRRLGQISRRQFEQFANIDHRHRLQSWSRAGEFWWLLSTVLAIGHASVVNCFAFLTVCPACLPALFSIFCLAFCWIAEHVNMISKNWKNPDKLQRSINLSFAIIVLFLVVGEVVIVAWMIWPQQHRYIPHASDLRKSSCFTEGCRWETNVECTTMKIVLVVLSNAVAVIKLIRTVPMVVFYASEQILQRKLRLERIRLSMLNCLQHMTAEMKFSRDLFPTANAYKVALQANHEFNQIIDAMLRIELKSNDGTIDVIPVIKTRQAMRMIGYELDQSVKSLVAEGCTEPESLEKWTSRIEKLREYAENLIDVPASAPIDKLNDVEWIYMLSVTQRSYILLEMSNLIETGNVERIPSHGCIYTEGSCLYYIKRGVCKVTEIQSTHIGTPQMVWHDYYINTGGFIGLKNILNMGKSNKLQPLKNTDTIYRACSDVELIQLTAAQWKKLFKDCPESWRTISMVEQKRRLRADLKRFSRDYCFMTDVEIALEVHKFVEVTKKVTVEVPASNALIPGLALHAILPSGTNVDEFQNIWGPATIIVQPTSPEIVGLYLLLPKPDQSEREHAKSVHMKSNMSLSISSKSPHGPRSPLRSDLTAIKL
uniref:Na_H_Exchanger domain-containing protein n=2 Tax=Panagrellus redivivus TaxID=6233 RepID=A0A7E4VAZ3_PANRE